MPDVTECVHLLMAGGTDSTQLGELDAIFCSEEGLVHTMEHMTAADLSLFATAIGDYKGSQSYLFGPSAWSTTFRWRTEPDLQPMLLKVSEVLAQRGIRLDSLPDTSVGNVTLASLAALCHGESIEVQDFLQTSSKLFIRLQV